MEISRRFDTRAISLLSAVMNVSTKIIMYVSTTDESGNIHELILSRTFPKQVSNLNCGCHVKTDN
jgi:hypothetical protein